MYVHLKVFFCSLLYILQLYYVLVSVGCGVILCICVFVSIRFREMTVKWFMAQVSLSCLVDSMTDVLDKLQGIKKSLSINSRPKAHYPYDF